jgi:hypothetical protein
MDGRALWQAQAHRFPLLLTPRQRSSRLTSGERRRYGANKQAHDLAKDAAEDAYTVTEGAATSHGARPSIHCLLASDALKVASSQRTESADCGPSP